MNQKQIFFNFHAKNWDQKHNFGDKEQIEELVTKFKIQEGAKVLDIGCGVGVLLSRLSGSVGKNGSIFALDFSLEMLKQAKQKRIAKNIIYINADAEKLPFKSNSFNYITCFATFPHLDQQQKSLEEMARALKPKGKLFISHLASREGINAFHKQGNKIFADDSLPEDENMKKMMKKVGFKKIGIINQPSLYLAYGEKG